MYFGSPSLRVVAVDQAFAGHALQLFGYLVRRPLCPPGDHPGRFGEEGQLQDQFRFFRREEVPQQVELPPIFCLWITGRQPVQEVGQPLIYVVHRNPLWSKRPTSAPLSDDSRFHILVRNSVNHPIGSTVSPIKCVTVYNWNLDKAPSLV